PGAIFKITRGRLVSKQLMIYENIQPLSDKHRTWAVNVSSYDFAAHLNSSPLLATEIPFAAGEYPIIFSATATEGEYLPLAVMGLKEGQNLFIDDNGRFSARYIPAFIRRYPFVLAGAKDAETLTLCIDEASKACIPDGSQRSEEHTSELQSRENLVCRLLLALTTQFCTLSLHDALPISLAVMGLKEGQNLFIDDNGRFSARYIPAFIRRYPFVLAGAKDAETLTLCIDEASKACIPDGSQ